MAENGSGSTGAAGVGAGSSRNVALGAVATTTGGDGDGGGGLDTDEQPQPPLGTLVVVAQGKKDNDLEFAVEATNTTGSAGATAGDLQILTNAMVAAEVAKKPLWVKTNDPVARGGEGKFPLEKQPYHMVPAVIKAWVAFVHHWRWATTTGLPVALISGKGSFGRKLAVLCNSMMEVEGAGPHSRIEPCTVASFNALPRVMSPLQYDAFLGNANTHMAQLKDYADAEPHRNEDGRLVVVEDDGTDFVGDFVCFLGDCLSSRHTDVVHQILCHVKLTDDQAEVCFSMAMARPNDFKATTKHPDPPVTAMQKELRGLLGLDPEQQLEIAVGEDHVEFVRTFGTEQTINTMGPMGRRPLLHLAVAGQNLSMMKVLLEKGADVHVRDNNHEGCTTLHVAVACQSEPMVKVLLEKGADVDARINDGDTALHLAVFDQNERMVKVLVEKGADVQARDNHGKTALMRAKQDFNQEIIALLAEKTRATSAKDKGAHGRQKRGRDGDGHPKSR